MKMAAGRRVLDKFLFFFILSSTSSACELLSKENFSHNNIQADRKNVGTAQGGRQPFSGRNENDIVPGRNDATDERLRLHPLTDLIDSNLEGCPPKT